MQKQPEHISSEDITNFLAMMEKTRDYSAATLNLAISAFKLFYKRVVGRDIVHEQKRPRQDKKLPAILSAQVIQLQSEQHKEYLKKL